MRSIYVVCVKITDWVASPSAPLLPTVYHPGDNYAKIPNYHPLYHPGDVEYHTPYSIPPG